MDQIYELCQLPIVSVTAIVLILAFFESIGYQSVSEMLYQSLGHLIGINKRAQRHQLKAEVVQLREQLKSISAMDEFAKWARLKRQVDKLSAEYDQLMSSDAMSKTAFTVKVSLALRVLVYIAYALLTFFHFRSPMAYLPSEWTGDYISRVLSLPVAPSNSISFSVWAFALRSVVRGAINSG
ncbi:hypothetical protein MIR68_003437 [Amoeboaphelidium protococcarum]|nr:hypothetical protein MIR68_003437 [Amoeboaphelidium protococcarum]